MRLLLVEDDPKILSFLENGLRQEGYAVDTAADGIEGLHLGASGRYDAAIIDIMLPGLDGLALIERLREKRVDTPVLILSAKREVDDRVQGPADRRRRLHGQALLLLGGPGAHPGAHPPRDARGRAHVAHRRRPPHGPPAAQGLAGRAEVDLRPRECALLEYLMRNAGRVVSKTSILEHVYDYSFDPQTNVVDVLVHRLRASVDKAYEEKLIRTVRGVGYVLEA